MPIKNIKRSLTLLTATFLLTGCASSVSFQLASLAAVAVTGKGFSEHALSVVTGYDCAFFNIVQGEKLCHNEDSADMLLLTDGRLIDSRLLIASPDMFSVNEHLVQHSTVPVQSFEKVYMVIGSFSDSDKAENHKKKYPELAPEISLMMVTSTPRYRVIVGPVPQQNIPELKRSLAETGISETWPLVL